MLLATLVTQHKYNNVIVNHTYLVSLNENYNAIGNHNDPVQEVGIPKILIVTIT